MVVMPSATMATTLAHREAQPPDAGCAAHDVTIGGDPLEGHPLMLIVTSARVRRAGFKQPAGAELAVSWLRPGATSTPLLRAAQRSIICCMASGYRSPITVISAAAASIAVRSPGVS